MTQSLRSLSITLVYAAIAAVFAMISGPSWAQTTTNSTANPVIVAPTATAPTTAPATSAPPALSARVRQLLLPKNNFEEYVRQNQTYRNLDVHQRPMNELTIPNIDIRNLDLDALLKRGGVDGGGGDELGLEFLSALGDANVDYKQYSYEATETFDWGDFNSYGSSLNVVAVDEPFIEDGRPSPRIARNNVETKTIQVQRAAWNAIRDRRIKNAIALNQGLLMREGKSTGYTRIAITSLTGQGLSGLVLFDGKHHELSAKDLQQTQLHQCLWSNKALERVAGMAEQEILTCAYRNTPGRLEVRANQFERLAQRCRSNCTAAVDAVVIGNICEQRVARYREWRTKARQILPHCVKETR